ncbi:hypothetical protein [Lacibacter sp.]|uniref:hypothetical protein n=1 Tax=Lacibacter sp. TaxID=1915409 RepID=UPI002B4B0FFB|nr:hypothetical protein [Lacibacter sp.]HLP35638.1 hypothetical protein [Lacibacter sp.]
MAAIMRTLLVISFLFLSKFCKSQEVNKLTLITAEYRVDSPQIGNFTYLIAYKFVNGVLFSKDTIAGFPTNKKGVPGSYVRFDLGENFIYKDRYIISGTGNVIDIETGTLVIEESDNFVESSGDTLVFYRNNIFTGTGFLHLNLKTSEYKFVNHKERIYDISFSPDQKQGLYVDRSVLPYKIILKRNGYKDKIIVPDAGNGPNLKGGSQFPTIRTYWLDNTSFLYTVHKIIYPIKEEVYSEVSIRKFNTLENNDLLFTKLDSINSGILNDKFYTDGIHNIIYRTSSGKEYIIDTMNSRLLPYPSYQFGFGFSTDNYFSKEYGRIIRYNESEIGRFWCSIQSVSKSAVAVEYGEVGSNLGYPKGLKVWTTESKSWTTIDVPWLCAIIGMIEDK